jgi:dephospho-CoA kinase
MATPANLYNDYRAMRLYKDKLYESLFKLIDNYQRPIIMEWALIIDDNLSSYFDYIFILDCPKKILLSRLESGDLSKEEIRKRIGVQLSTRDKLKNLSDYNYMVIDSSTDIDTDKVISKIKEVIHEV